MNVYRTCKTDINRVTLNINTTDYIVKRETKRNLTVTETRKKQPHMKKNLKNNQMII